MRLAQLALFLSTVLTSRFGALLGRVAIVASLVWVLEPATALAQPAPAPAPAPKQPAGAGEADADDAEDVDVDDAEEPAPSAPAAGAPAAPDAGDEGAGDEDTGDEDGELMEEELEGTDMGKAPPKGKGAIVGIVTDTKYREPLVEAQLDVLGIKVKALTDLEGRYRLELPPGTYDIRCGYELHKTSRAQGVVVVAGKLTRLDMQLVPDESSVDEIAVETEVERTTAEGQMLERKRSAVVSDNIGRAEIARSPDKNAADAARRVVGATIVGDRFIFIRGLGERYTNALLNGTPLPSTEPDRNVVPLDLFPALILEGINITKQFTPDMPGDFAGGSVRINTRDFPKETLFQISLNTGYVSGTTFTDRLAQRPSSTDWLGFDGGLRQPPDNLPNRRLDAADPTRDTSEDYAIGQQMNSYMSALRKGTPPNYGGSIVAGDGWKIGNDQKLGGIAAISYGRSYRSRDVSYQRFTTAPMPDGSTVIRVADHAGGERSVDQVRWGAFGSLSYAPSRDNKLELIGFHSQAADSEALGLEGFNEGRNETIHITHLDYVSRSLNFGQLRGTHTINPFNKAELGWFASIAGASRDQPDLRDVVYAKRPESYDWSTGTDSGTHFFGNQSETSVSGGLDYTQPLVTRDELDAKLKMGGLVSQRDRDFASRRFLYETTRETQSEIGGPDGPRRCAGTTWREECPDQIFRNEYIGPGGLNFREWTLPFDSYTASLDIYAGYLMVDAMLIPKLRMIGGARVEVTDAKFHAIDPYGGGDPIDTKIESTDWLPAASLVYQTTRNVSTRFGISRTLARPQLREVAPYLGPSFAFGLPVQGNPDLKLTRITNVDLRMEYIPKLSEVLAFSFFFKHFTDPIEELIVPGTGAGTISYANAASAELIGIELEARKSLDFLTDALKDFAIKGDVTLAKSLVDLGPARGGSTDPQRPLSFQSPYIVNVYLDYSNPRSGTDARLLYNVFGARIVTVGQRGIPDTYELPQHKVDAMVGQKIGKHFDLKLTVENLLGADIVFAHRGAQQYDRNPMTGVLTPGVEDPETYRADVGTTIALAGTYTY